MTVLDQPGEMGHDLVAEGVQIAERRRAVRRHDGRAGGHGHSDATSRLLAVVEAVALPRKAVLGVVREVRREHDPVPDRHRAELQG